eukprot:TRINITY_DN9215_c0_g1::TRINITY_DN9215_c0_g1_i1::g.13235::m.13235 TRINITY_DN9215_c0_g1::TRINITY_DN9215_c0_g1_i1::g.13235  ORF type:complete len:746 (+),score=59.66,sp/Q9SGP2/HSL1_ARATH/30.05/5e-44,sp/Q9SGP2/HSL1_ARATH/25.39/3e-13,sp/Q9SGP2/HSL1_ARATH/30.10/3e-12,sp/Q9SGP2/HSL1_ARATH/27.62/1e-10,LRR_1/PF00560.28/3.9e+02,LRR_1/PF00560.28/1.1,LRR_1/PF00560.28/44,LRR_1/PF00560.28/8.1,LRR_1/PF00560.28/0.012,LRR_1/PF00560.28/3.4,LRR_1/PF00560.28/25,LRR_1/PF00560.28/13,LRR_1/PF00560.28/0.0079,LRR_1/PF005
MDALRLYGLSSDQTLSGDLSTLENMYYTYAGSTWDVSDGWMNNSVSHCTWFGVSCGFYENGTSYLTKISLSSNGLSGGPLLSSLGQISTLTSLDLSNNAIDGTIPVTFSTGYSASCSSNSTCASLASWKSIQSLSLAQNALTGTIPFELSTLSTLLTLDLSSNQLAGSVPTYFGGFSWLTSLDLSNNNLDATIPPEFSTMTSLKSLNLAHNDIDGSIPVKFGTMPYLKYMNLTNNARLTGGVPAELCARRSMEIYLDGTFLDCVSLAYIKSRSTDAHDIPCACAGRRIEKETLCNDEIIALRLLYLSTDGDDWTNNANWLNLNVDRCSWFGVVCVNAEITALNLANNSLSGTLPEELAWVTTLTSLNVSNNKLSGTIPPSFANLTKFTSMDLSKNQFSGSLPTALGGLSPLYLNGSYFTCDSLFYVKSALTDAHGIACDCDGQETSSDTFCVDAVDLLRLLYESTNGDSWKISTNWLNSSVSPCDWFGVICNGSEVSQLDLSNNSLSGTLPVELFMLQSLTVTRLSHNSLTGTIPPIGSSIIEVDLSYNNFGGFDDDTIAGAVGIEILNLAENSLKGSVPSKLSELERLTELYLDGNHLNGTITLSDATDQFRTISLGGGSNQFFCCSLTALNATFTDAHTLPCTLR